MTKKSFQKPALTLSNQIELLRERGLSIKDISAAEFHLKYIGYYRLSGYFSSFQTDKNLFINGVNFEDILEIYFFDRKLRNHLLDALERIEISLKAVMINALSTELNPFWYTDQNNFMPKFKHSEFIEKIEKEARLNQEKYLKAYSEKYTNPHPPCWILFQALSFGTISTVFKWLRTDLRKKICREFDLPDPIFTSWIENSCYVRNLCAHHSRLWNRTFTKSPKIMKVYEYHMSDNKHIYSQLFIISFLLRKITKTSKWDDNLKKLIEPFDAHAHLGIGEKFQDAYWKI